MPPFNIIPVAELRAFHNTAKSFVVGVLVFFGSAISWSVFHFGFALNADLCAKCSSSVASINESASIKDRVEAGVIVSFPFLLVVFRRFPHNSLSEGEIEGRRAGGVESSGFPVAPEDPFAD